MITTIEFMYNVLLKFSFKDEELADFDHMDYLLGSFVHNGQMIEYFDHPVITENTAVYNGIIIQADSLNIRYYTENTNRFLQLLKEDQTEFEYEIVSEKPYLEAKSIADASGLILHFGGESPLRTLDHYYNVPLYLLPPTSVDGTNYQNIITWERNYEAIYRLWFVGLDESYYYNQLTNYQSDLSIEGMELCKQIHDLTKKDCYYNLFRDLNPDVKELENCPKCNTPWKMENELFETFKYKCSNCFLIY
jgi:predicted  nucleic acid-binding Zn ribbon protein